jgi:myo-inositol 2-dehydrogenase / D-chiro-inositol 1-dehydrogenase
MADTDNRRTGVTRRTFLAAVPAAATAANSAVTIGLIGCGGRGRFDSGYMAKAPGARFVAVCDLFEDRMELARNAIAPGARRYSDYRELLASDVDAVLIATNEFTHPELFEAAVQAGKHIYIEKPAGIDLEGCRRVTRANRTARPDRTIMFGFQQRYAPGYRKARKLVESGGIGRVQMAVSHWIKGAVTDKQPVLPHPTNMLDKIRYSTWWRDSVGDIIVDTYVHGVDVLNWFLGGHPSKAVGAGGRSVRKSGDVMDHCTAIFSYPNGVDATLVGSQIAPLFYRAVNEQFFGANAAVETAREYWTHYRGKSDTVTEQEPREITAEAVEEFVARIAGNRPINTADSAVESTLTAILGRTAIYGRREVTWEEMLKS